MSHVSRLGALVAASALAVTGVTLVAVPAQAASDPRPLTQGASWIAGQLQDGLLPGPFGSPDRGLSIDAATSLIAAGGHASDVAAVGSALDADIESYIDFAYSYAAVEGATPDDYAGQAAAPTAKALRFAQSLASPTTTLDGINLLTRLEGFVAPAAPIKGRLVGVATKNGEPDPFGEYNNVIGQAFGAGALAAAGSSLADEATDFLLTQQCSAGYFRLELNYDKEAAGQSCDAGRAVAGASDPDTDVTAIALRQLLPQAETSAKVARAVGKAEAWLISQQRADGSFGGGKTTSASNTNSTGIAGWVLGDLGNDDAATRAAAWVRGQQADELAGCANALSTQTGALALNTTALEAGRKNGIGPAADQWRRATAQALPVLQWAPATTTPALNVTGPAGYVKQGTTATYQVSGVVPGDKVCVVLGGTKVSTSANGDGKASVKLVLPAGTATRTVSVTDRAATSDTVPTQVLGAKKLTVKVSKTKIKKNKKIKVTVTGLAPGEKVLVKVRSSRKTGTANAQGMFVATLKPGSKLGKFTVTAVGQFTDIRRGTTSVKVVKK